MPSLGPGILGQHAAHVPRTTVQHVEGTEHAALPGTPCLPSSSTSGPHGHFSPFPTPQPPTRPSCRPAPPHSSPAGQEPAGLPYELILRNTSLGSSPAMISCITLLKLGASRTTNADTPVRCAPDSHRNRKAEEMLPKEHQHPLLQHQSTGLRHNPAPWRPLQENPSAPRPTPQPHRCS